MIAQLREHEEAFQVKEAALPAIGLGDREYARVPRKETAIKLLFRIDEKHEAYQMAELKSASPLHFLKTDCEKAWKQRNQRVISTTNYWDGIRFSQAGVGFQSGDIKRFAYYSETFGDNTSPAPMLDSCASLAPD
jgi:hypothetical protein